MIHEEVLFTLQMATVVSALHQEVASIVRTSYGLSYLAFCSTASVHSRGGRMPLSNLPHNVLAQPNSVAVAANASVRRGYLSKVRRDDDQRTVELLETSAGEAILQEGFDTIYHHFKATAWRRCTASDIEAIACVSAAAAIGLGIDSIEDNTRLHAVVTPASLMGIMALLRRWEDVVRTFSGLSLAEYRCLAFLEHRSTSLSCADIADGLRLDRSTVSSLVSRLSRAGLVSTRQGTDRRSRLIALTDRGKVAAALVTARLGDATAEAHAALNPELKAKANELHMRMYTTYCS